jgi:osmotically-inducible protein OsmY
MRYYIVLFLLLSSLLSSCVAVIVAGAATSMIVYDKRNLVMLERDARIFHLVHDKIVNDPSFQESRISVVSFNQIVLLIGQVSNQSLRKFAETITYNTPNVKHTYNQLTVSYPLSLTKRTNDTVITTQVRSKMLGREGLHSGFIRIITEDRVVYLMGTVNQEQANLAVDVARKVKGVRKVVKIFQYIA